ncbi:MAG: hypothetical protein ACYDC6_16115 [Acidobacteriaceae bacterium]
MSSTRTASIHDIHDLVFTVQYGDQTQVITDEDVDRKTAEATVSVLRQVVEMVPTLLEKRRVQKWDALVEALMPDVVLSPTKVIEAEMKSAAMTQILASQDFVTAGDIARLGKFSVKNPSSQPNRWKRMGQIFAIHHRGADYYPLYALDPANGYRPRAIVADVLRLFADSKDSWGTAFWFGSINSYLQEQRPQDVLNADPEPLLRAARAEAEGLQHG